MKVIIMFIMVVSLLIAGCNTQSDNTKLANPASVNCIDKGGSLDINDDQVGMCTLPDGTICEEWAFYRNECPQKACTADAKLCPDGSTIARTGPDCEFAPCPTQACTEEAKVCPDGSTVARTGPDCEFQKCPGEDNEGILEGTISIGPICPVERMPPDPNCQPKQETFDAWKILVLKNNNKIAELEPNLDGAYRLTLEAGSYTLDFKEQHGIGGNSLPKDITIRNGGTTEVNIDIDTGIR